MCFDKLIKLSEATCGVLLKNLNSFAEKNQPSASRSHQGGCKLVADSDAGYGPALSQDGKSILLGCGPKQRQVPEAEAIMLPVPAK